MPVVTIRPISMDDIDVVHQYASDKRISDTCNVPHPYTREIAKDWFEAIATRQNSGQAKVYSICLNANFVGVISLDNIDLDLKKAEVNYWIGVDFHGKGIATLAVSKILEIARLDLGIKTLTSGALARNAASHAVQKKNGFLIVDEFRLSEGKFSGENYVVSQIEIE